MNEGKFQDGANPGTVLTAQTRETGGYNTTLPQFVYQLCWMQLTCLWHNAGRMAQQVEEPACHARDTGDRGLIPGAGRSLKEEMATHPGILAWRIPQTEEPGGLGPQSCRESDTSDRVNTYIQHIYSQLYSRHHPHHRAQG